MENIKKEDGVKERIDYVREELSEIRVEKKKFYIQFSKIAVLLLIFNIFFIEVVGVKLMMEFGDLSALYALFAIAGTDCTAGVIWYMKNSSEEKKARTMKELQLMKIERLLEAGYKINPEDFLSVGNTVSSLIDSSGYGSGTGNSSGVG